MRTDCMFFYATWYALMGAFPPPRALVYCMHMVHSCCIDNQDTDIPTKFITNLTQILSRHKWSFVPSYWLLSLSLFSVYQPNIMGALWWQILPSATEKPRTLAQKLCHNHTLQDHWHKQPEDSAVQQQLLVAPQVGWQWGQFGTGGWRGRVSVAVAHTNILSSFSHPEMPPRVFWLTLAKSGIGTR